MLSFLCPQVLYGKEAANEEDLKLVQAFLNEHNLKAHILSDEDKEGIVLRN
jgi:hypothetical protein